MMSFKYLIWFISATCFSFSLFAQEFECPGQSQLRSRGRIGIVTGQVEVYGRIYEDGKLFKEIIDEQISIPMANKPYYFPAFFKFLDEARTYKQLEIPLDPIPQGHSVAYAYVDEIGHIVADDRENRKVVHECQYYSKSNTKRNRDVETEPLFVLTYTAQY